jgi:hypothetical protein
MTFACDSGFLERLRLSISRLSSVSGHHETTAAVEHEPHSPTPSLSPVIIGLGVTILAFGILFGLMLIALGAVILVIGLATWLIDDARAYVAAGDPTGHGGH